MDDLTEVEVTENNPLDVNAEDFVGMKFYVQSDATPDGTTLYPLYNSNKQLVGIKVKITDSNDQGNDGPPPEGGGFGG